MRLSQAEFDSLIARQANFNGVQRVNEAKSIPLPLKTKKASHSANLPAGTNAADYQDCDTAQKKSLKIILPFALPTWNKILAMGIWQRKKERDRIHAAVLKSVRSASA